MVATTDACDVRDGAREKQRSAYRLEAFSVELGTLACVAQQQFDVADTWSLWRLDQSARNRVVVGKTKKENSGCVPSALSIAPVSLRHNLVQIVR